jgi:hypothetical protein
MLPAAGLSISYLAGMHPKVKYHGEGRYAFWCPGCKHDHIYYTVPPHPNGASWQFNGDIITPSFTPSLLNRWGIHADPNWKPPENDFGKDYGKMPYSGICHLFVTGGVINFCGDCSHEMSGMQNVPMREYTD